MLKLFTLALALLAMTQPAFAEIDKAMPETKASSEFQVIKVEGLNISIPSPSGFVATADTIPELTTLFQQYIPANSTLFEIFATQDNLDGLIDGSQLELEKYFLIMQPEAMQKKNFTKKDIQAIAESFKESGEDLFDSKIKNRINSSVEKGNRSLSKLVDEKVDIKLSKIGFLGVSEVTDNTLIFSMRADISTDKPGEKDTMIASSAFLLVGGKILMFAAYANEYDSASRESGLAWTQSEVSKWTKAILLSNALVTEGN